jgi:hypothetical protein
MTLDSNLSNVIIEGNNYDYGNFVATATGITPTTYGYYNCLYTNADANIISNYFGAATSSGTHLYVTNNADGYGSCLITKNTFVRNTTAIAAYIDVSTVTTDQIIVENIFDQYTVDGSNENIVTLPPAPATNGPFILYERNKNQTAYKPIQKAPYMTFSSGYPTINPSERTIYSDGTSPNYIGNPGYYYGSNFTATSYKQQGVTMNYATPFPHNSYVEITGVLDVTNGSTNVSSVTETFDIRSSINATPAGPLAGYIVFGDDNAYYSVTITFLSNGLFNTMTLGSPYLGTTATVSRAIFWPQATSLSYSVPGTFSGSSGSGTVTSSSNQWGTVGIGSLLLFNSGDSTIYTATAISPDGKTLTVSPNLATNLSSNTATTGLSIGTFNFSINLSEVLPENVQVISTVFGVYGNNNVASLASANYGANIMTDQGGAYDSNLPGTFSVTYNSTSVTASTNQTGYISANNGICFTSQPDFVYPVASIGSGTNITLSIPYSGTTNTSTTAVNFQNSMADAANYSITGYAVGPLGDNITFYVNNASGNIPTSVFALSSQYIKIDPPSSAFAAYTGSGRLLRWNLQISVSMITPGSLFFPESPLIIKYRW